MNGCQVIHGDTVMSNVLLCNDDSVKFLDMRGMQGSELCIGGDATYDLAKTCQSLLGYDFMLLDWAIDEQVKVHLKKLQDFFWAFVREKYPAVRQADVTLITCSHFLGIVPLHENRAHQALYLKHCRLLATELGLKQ